MCSRVGPHLENGDQKTGERIDGSWWFDSWCLWRWNMAMTLLIIQSWLINLTPPNIIKDNQWLISPYQTLISGGGYIRGWVGRLTSYDIEIAGCIIDSNCSWYLWSISTQTSDSPKLISPHLSAKKTTTLTGLSCFPNPSAISIRTKWQIQIDVTQSWVILRETPLSPTPWIKVGPHKQHIKE